MDENFICEQCGNKFVGQYNGANFARYCSKECKDIVQAKVNAWTYSGQWLNDLSALTNGIAAHSLLRQLDELGSKSSSA